MARLTMGSGHGSPIRATGLGTLLVGTAVAFGGMSRPVAAQSEYHWSDQFGNKSTLLNGTVIGGVSDLGAVFYNPGRLARLLRPGFLLTAEAFEITRTEVKIGGGDRNQVEQASLRGLPSLVSGMFTLPSLPGHRFAYSFLTRRRSDSDLLLTTDERGDFLPGSPGEEIFLGTWGSRSKLDENWVGMTWSKGISDRWSVGVSMFGTYLGRMRHFQRDNRVLDRDGEASVFSRLREYRITSYGLLWKAGMVAELEPFRIGVSLTTPEITAFGSGSLRYDDLLIPPASGDGNQLGGEVVVFKGDGLGVSTRSPFSVGAGLSWITGRAEIHVSGEWYSGVSPYRILGVDSIPSQATGEVHRYEVLDELEPVLNFGVGIEWQVTEAFSTYGSVIRDASAAPHDIHRPFTFEPRVSNSTSQADGYFVGLGISFQARWIDLTAGATYGATRDTVEDPLFPGSVPPGVVPPEIRRLHASRQRIRFLLGFTIPMVEEITDEPGGP